MWYSVLIASMVAYLLGNLNGAVCISQMMHDDVRSHGSGNAGLTNFIRNYGASKSLLVILIDAGKAVMACLTAGLLLNPFGFGFEGSVLGGLCVMLGHDFPALLGFRGGKGILSGWFVAWVVDWRIGVFHHAPRYAPLQEYANGGGRHGAHCARGLRRRACD